MQQTMERTAVKPRAGACSYATILVHAEPGLASSHRVEVAARLARDFGAGLIGLGAETFDPALYSGPFTGFAAGEWVTLVQDQLTRNLAAAESAFQRDAAGVESSWRTVQDYPHRALVDTAHAADLIVVSPRADRSLLQTADPADVVMDAGRPVLIVPNGGAHVVAKTVVVAWKNTRECRRALTDALPFLQRAEQVIVTAVTKPDMAEAAARETDDVVANLKRHGVEARALVSANAHEPVEDELQRIADQNGADLIVAGAYGHTRLREWAFGGVTDRLIHQPRCFVLLSH